MYYISNICVITDDGSVSEISLKDGLNIIYGPSNTGKSLIVDCIEFLTGSKGRNDKNRNDESVSYKRLSKPELKIKEVSLSIVVDGAEIKLHRDIEEPFINVVSKVCGIESGRYSINKGSKKTPAINKVWLRILGIYDEDIKIVMKSDGSLQGLTIRTFIHTFIINESRIVSENSVMKNGHGYVKNIPIPTVSSLIYLAADKSLALPQKEEGDSEDVIIAKKSTALQMYDRSISALADKKFVEMIETEDLRSVSEIKEEIDKLLNEIGAAEDSLKYATEKSSLLAISLSEVEDKLAECLMLKNRYASLRSQYESDIRRLTFIAEGDLHKDKLPKVEHCPFCNGQLQLSQSKSCVEAAVAEVKKIEVRIADLRDADSEIDREINMLVGKKEYLVDERQKYQTLIRGDLQPQIEDLRKRLVSYTAAMERAKVKEMLEAFTTILKEQYEAITAIDEGVEENPKFNVMAAIDEYITEPLSKQIGSILQECNYYNYLYARFDPNLCDVVVNGADKMSQGKGFRAFLNAVMAIAIQEWLINCNVYPTHLLVMDSPILSLKEREEKVGTQIITDRMRSGLFTYLVKHQANRQTIILENEIPKIDYSGVNLIHFTGKEGEGVYGLVKDYRE